MKAPTVDGNREAEPFQHSFLSRLATLVTDYTMSSDRYPIQLVQKDGRYAGGGLAWNIRARRCWLRVPVGQAEHRNIVSQRFSPS
jgi:hypothetical protein